MAGGLAPWKAALAALAAAALTAAALLVARQPAPAPAAAALLVQTPTPRPLPTRRPTPRALAVYVSGAVATPGVYTLRAGARVDAALSAAGGADADADLDRVNLAALVTDGEQVAVPHQGEATPTPARAGRAGSTVRRVTATPTPPGDWLLNVNSASAGEFQALPGLGKTTAERIVAYREQHGPYASVDELLKAGVRKAELDRIKARLTVQ